MPSGRPPSAAAYLLTFEALTLTTVLDVDRTLALNDILRRSLSGSLLMFTAGVIAPGRERQQIILDAIAAYDDFTPDNDPRGEHDFGALEVAGERVFFKIDYYDRAVTITPRILAKVVPSFAFQTCSTPA